MHQAFDAGFQFHKSAELGRARHDAVDDGTDGEAILNIVPRVAFQLLEADADLAGFLVELDDGDFDLDLEVMYRSFRLPYLSFVPEVTSVNDNDKREALTKSIELIDKYERRVRKSNHIKINHLDDLCNDIKFCVRSFF